MRGADQDSVTPPKPRHPEVHPGPPFDSASQGVRAVQEGRLHVSRRGLPEAGHLRDGLPAPGGGGEGAEGTEAERDRGHDGEGIQEAGFGAAEGDRGLKTAIVIAAKIDIAKKAEITKALTPLFMRRTLHDLDRSAHVHEFVVRAISGHATTTMQERYSSVSGDEVRTGSANRHLGPG